MPHGASYDLVSGARRILHSLSAFKARAVFFIVGRIVEDYPELIHDLAEAGHESGSTVMTMTQLLAYDAGRLAALDDNLSRVEALMLDITGTRPLCFRAPYLLGPHFYGREIYSLLTAHGYRWVSNLRDPVSSRATSARSDTAATFVASFHGGCI